MIYLDNAATSFPKPEPVYQALDKFARTSLANPGRAGHRMAMAAERTLDDARHALNQFFRGEALERWIFTCNCTDSLNLAIKGIVKPGDHVITSDLEHNSVSRPLRKLEKDGVITLTRLVSKAGYLDPEDVRLAINPKTSLVVLTHASNVLGTVQPIEAIAAIVRASGALFLVDAAQSAGVVPIDLKATPIDLLAFPGPQGPLRPHRHRRPLRRTPGQPARLEGRGHRRRLVERNSTPATPLLPRRRHAQRPRDRRTARRPDLGRRSRGRGWPEARGRPAPEGRRLDRSGRRLALRRTLGAGNPRRGALLDRARRDHAPGTGWNSRRQL